VICAGGGGIPTMYQKGADRKLIGVEAVIDKDLCTELLARDLDADLFVMLTDADAVLPRLGHPDTARHPPGHARSTVGHRLRGGLHGPKVNAACAFAQATGKKAAIGALEDLSRIIAGEAGTTISVDGDGMICAT